MNWTKPYLGVQHLGSFSTTKSWCTVEDHNSFAILSKWVPGCRFSPEEINFPTVEQAKKAGEEWLENYCCKGQ